jgi:hypothetical protein
MHSTLNTRRTYETNYSKKKSKCRTTNSQQKTNISRNNTFTHQTIYIRILLKSKEIY